MTIRVLEWDTVGATTVKQRAKANASHPQVGGLGVLSPLDSHRRKEVAAGL